MQQANHRSSKTKRLESKATRK
uniref:Uncharacterized protein n=1 Tax=Arundo donax TaxID=35708 RepID=A0A0A9BR06_ARUDO